MPVVPDRARLRRPGAAAARGRRPGRAAPRHDRRLRRHGERRRRGHAAAVAGDPPARPRRAARSRRPALGSVGRLLAPRSASSTTRRSRCASSTSAASWTPRCCAASSATRPRYTTEAALADYARTVRARGRRRELVESATGACAAVAVERVGDTADAGRRPAAARRPRRPACGRCAMPEARVIPLRPDDDEPLRRRRRPRPTLGGAARRRAGVPAPPADR